MTGGLVCYNHIGSFFRFALLSILLVCGLPIDLAVAQPDLSIEAQPAEQHILLLYAYGYGGRGVELFSDGFFKAVAAEGFPVANVYAEYLDLERRKDDPEYRRQLLGFLHKKYAGRRIDLVVTIQQPAIEFLLNEGGEIAPGAPVITIQPPSSLTEVGSRRIIGESSRFDIKGTLERALELFPRTRRVVFVSGSSSADSKVAEEAARVASPWQGKLEFEYTTGLSLDDILCKVAHLPPHTIIIFTQYNVDTKGCVALAYEVEGKITRVANAPVFGFYDFNLRNGGIGGSVIAVEELGASAGRLALDILNGTFQSTEPVTLHESKSVPMFDWNQIKRWDGDTRRLSVNTVFLNRPPTAWEQYRRYIVGVLVFIFAELFLIIVLLVNIRRRAVAEAARTESEATARTLLDLPNAEAFLIDREGICLDANETMAERFAGKVSAIIGSPVWDLFSPEVSRKLKEHFQEVLRTKKQVHYEDEHQGRWNDSIISPILEDDGEVSKAAVFSFDITERKRAEDELKQRQADLLEIQHIGKIASLNWDLQNDTIRWTPELFSIVERDAQSFPHTGAGYLSLIHPEDRKLIEKAFEDSLLGKVAPYMEYRFVMPDDRNKYVGSQGKFIHDGKGNPMCMIGYIQDITERKEAEEEKRKLEEQLRHAQKMESVGRLAGGVAHDFNNMLGVILGYAELLKIRFSPGSPILNDVLEIEKAGIRSRDITRQLLAFSRKQVIAPRPIDLNALITDTKKTLGRLIGEDIDLSFRTGKDPCRIKADPSQIDQILVNLVINARDAMPRGGMLSIATGNVYLDEAYCLEHLECKQGQYVLLEVSDEGVGMDKEILSHIFEPFFTTKEMGQGTGLGLATVYGIVKQNGGFINAYSEPGQGSTFKIHIPRLMEEDQEPMKEEEAPGSTGAGTVLLVEDDVMIREMTQRMLERIGYTVLAAETPMTALSLCGNGEAHIDLLLTDVVMPEMSGKELADRIEALKPGTRVLFMSGYTSNVIARRGVLEEGVHFIQKPFSMGELTHKVSEAMSHEVHFVGSLSSQTPH